MGFEMKLALGTVKFGMNYGLDNQQVSKEEVFKILNYAITKGIDTIDTAYAYGDSENVIGEFGNKNLRIVTKVNEIEEFEESLSRLKTDRVYGCLIHSFEKFLKKQEIWESLKKKKEQGKVEKIGFSLYRPKEVKMLLDGGIKFDIVQIPYSIFDQRFEEIFPLLKNVEVHIRSVFLQGLMFKDPEELGAFGGIKMKLIELNRISKESGLPISTLCINFVVLNKDIDKVVLGVDSLSNLQEDIMSLEYKDKVKLVYGKLRRLKENDENLILPINWRHQDG